MADFEKLLGRLGSDNTNGYLHFPLPSPVDEEVELLVTAVVEQDHESDLLLQMNQSHGYLLLAFAERMAALAIRRDSADLLRTPAAALAIASKLIDFRDVLIVLSLVANSATRLGVDLPTLFPTSVLKSTDELRPSVDGFMKRSVRDRSIQAMGYIEDEDEGGFRYRRTW